MTVLGSRKLTLTIDGDEVSAEVTSAKFTSADAASGDISFAEAAANGGKQYALVLKFFQDPSVDSLWDKVWSASGSDVPIVLHPNGGATADATHPKFSATATISEPDGDLLGGDASRDSSIRYLTEVTWLLTGKPVRSFT